MVKYPKFEDWFYEIENYGLRAERFWDSMSQFATDSGKMANIEVWLRAAFESAQQGVEDECSSIHKRF